LNLSADSRLIMNPEAPVLAIGGAVIDLIGRLSGELQPGSSTPAAIRTSFGGVARNVAENLARLGQQVTLITTVGEDDAGDRLLHQVQAAGVDTHAVLKVSEYITGTYVGLIDHNGQLKYAIDDVQAISALTPSYISSYKHLIHDASLVFVDANLPKETLRRIFSLAHKAHVPVFADPTSVSLADRLIPFLNSLAMVTPNTAEATILCGHPLADRFHREALDAAKCLIGQGVGIALITLAQFGLVYASSETSGHVPAIQTPILDPTGAGDALTATIIFALLNDIPLDDAVRLGVTAASLTLRHQGSVIPDLSLEMLYDNLLI
jgi:pseudouridine kinase